MIPSFAILTLVLAAPPLPPPPVDELPTAFWQVAPDAGPTPWLAPPAAGANARAVVLVPGLHVHPLRPTRVLVPDRRPWQEPKSELVKALAKDSDVFAFGYAQSLGVDEVVRAPGLANAVARLRNGGYKEIVLVGHSAGGVIARAFVERNPDAGVTKVIAVGAPFAGSKAATVTIGYPRVQKPFIQSLTPAARAAAANANRDLIGKDLEFVCVVCKLKRAETDGIVPVDSQWPEDLQKLGVPMELAAVSHLDAMHNAATARTIAKLVREKLVRWSPEEAELARKILHNEPAREK